MNNTLKQEKIFKALSDKNRLRILKMLHEKSLCVCEVTEILQLATSTVSQHLSILREAGFIIEYKDGKWVNYIINPKPSDPRVSKVLNSLDFWINDDQIINKDSQKLKVIDRNKICSR